MLHRLRLDETGENEDGGPRTAELGFGSERRARIGAMRALEFPVEQDDRPMALVQGSEGVALGGDAARSVAFVGQEITDLRPLDLMVLDHEHRGSFNHHAPGCSG